MNALARQYEVTLDFLFLQIRNMTILVDKLETLDKNNVLAIRREVLALKNKLKECEASQGKNIPVSPPGPAPGTRALGLPLEPGPRGALGGAGEGLGVQPCRQDRVSWG